MRRKALASTAAFLIFLSAVLIIAYNTPTVRGATAQITLNPNSGTVGTAVTVTGSGFTNSRAITITFNSAAVGVTANVHRGNFRVVFVVPSSAAGTYMVTAKSQLSRGHESVSAWFTVVPAVTSCDLNGVQQTSFSSGEPVYCCGTGFDANTRYTICLFDASSYMSDGHFTPPIERLTVFSDKTGTFGVRELWSSAQHGTYYIAVYDSNGKLVLHNPSFSPVVVGSFFVMPEYSIGAFAALGACLLALTIHKRKNLPTLNLKNRTKQK